MARTNREKPAPGWSGSLQLRPGGWSDSPRLKRLSGANRPTHPAIKPVPAQREITSAANGSGQHARRWRNTTEPPQARPARAMATVEGSGTATGLARRKPPSLCSYDGELGNLMEVDK